MSNWRKTQKKSSNREEWLCTGEACRAEENSKDGCGLRYWTGTFLEPSPLFPVYMTIPYFPIEASAHHCICRSRSITPVEWEIEICGILEPVEQTAAALLNLSANMLYLETGTTTSYSEVRAALSCWGDIPLVGPSEDHGTKEISEGKGPLEKSSIDLLNVPSYKIHLFIMLFVIHN